MQLWKNWHFVYKNDTNKGPTILTNLKLTTWDVPIKTLWRWRLSRRVRWSEAQQRNTGPGNEATFSPIGWNVQFYHMQNIVIILLNCWFLQNRSVLFQKTCQSRVRRVRTFENWGALRGTECHAVEPMEVTVVRKGRWVSTTAHLGYERSSDVDWF